MDRLLEIRTRSIHFIHESNPRHPILIRLSPNRFALWLYSSHPTEYCDRSVQNPEGTLDFSRKVHVSWGIDNVDPVHRLLKTFDQSCIRLDRPETGGGSGGNRDTTFPLLLHPIGHGGAFMHLSHFMNATRIKKHPLR